LSVPEQVGACDVMMMADLATPHPAEELFCPIRAGTVQAIGFLVVDPLHLWLDNKCSAVETGVQSKGPEQIIPDQGAEASKNGKYEPEQQEKRSADPLPNPLVPPDILQAIKEKIRGENPAASTGDKPRNWGHTFLCDVKVTDALVALFTLCLVAIGAWQGYALYQTVAATNTSALALTQAERAHVFVRIVNQNFGEILSTLNQLASSRTDRITAPAEVEFCFKNYGKTPAIVKEIAHDIILRREFPDEIDYIPVDLVPTERIIPTDNETEKWKCLRTDFQVGDARDVIRAYRSFWFYGRVLYDDVFGIEHEHRFIYRYNGSRGWRAFHHPKYSKNT
jgi:hypothetical protein